MTTLLELLRAELSAAPDVAALVGGGASARIHPQVAPDGAQPPYLILTVISDVPDHTYTSRPSTQATTARVQIDSYARGYREAHQLAAAVEEVLASIDRPDLAAERTDQGDSYEREAGLHRVSADYSVWR